MSALWGDIFERTYGFEDKPKTAANSRNNHSRSGSR